MSYQVIALKWRPQTFDRMIGQKHVSQTLVNALKTERLPQALLFTGPRGTGKTSTARILAKSLRCIDLKNDSPCGVCSECVDISSGRSLDVIEIDGASNNGVDSIRELRDAVSFRPTTGSKKVYIIDEVHMLSINAFNALLKTLEEPPDHVIFILATTEVHKIPKTILSRCHRFDFRKISIQEVADYLEHICKEENVKFEKEALWAIARQGEGSVRDAFSFLDQVITYTDKNVTYESVIESLGLTDRRLLTRILKNITSQDKQALLEDLNSIFASGTDAGVFAEDFLQEIKSLLVIKSCSSPKDFVDLPEAEIQLLQSISEDISEAHIHLLFDMMLQTTQDLLRSQDQRTVLEVGLLKLCLYPQVVDLDRASAFNNFNNKTNSAVSSQVNRNASPIPTPTPMPIKNVAPEVSPVAASSPQKRVESPFKAAPNPVVQNQRQQEVVVQKPKISSPEMMSESQKMWHDFVAKVKRLNSKVGATLQNCIYDIKGKTVLLAAPDRLAFIKEELEQAEFQKVLSNYIKTFLGPDYILDLKIDQKSIEPEKNEVVTTAAKEQEHMTAEEKKRLMERVNSNEAVKKLKETFKDSEIVAIREIKS